MILESKLYKSTLSLCERSLPLFLASIVLGSPSDPLDLAEYAHRLLVLCSLFASWWIARTLGFSILARHSEGSPKDRTTEKWIRLRILGFAIAAFATAAFLFQLQVRADRNCFTLALILLGLGALSEALMLRGRASIAAVLRLIYGSGLGVLSFMTLGFAYHWQYNVLAMALSCLLTASFIARQLAEHSTAPWASSTTRSLQLLLFAGPTFVALLSYARQLPPSYVLTFAVLPFAATLNSQLKEGKIPQFLSRQVSSICLLFAVILLTLRLLYIP